MVEPLVLLVSLRQLKPSSRQRRSTFLRLTRQPFMRSNSPTLRYPYRPYCLASRIRARRKSSSFPRAKLLVRVNQSLSGHRTLAPRFQKNPGSPSRSACPAQVGHGLLQPPVLPLKRLQLRKLGPAHTAVLLAPPIVGRILIPTYSRPCPHPTHSQDRPRSPAKDAGHPHPNDASEPSNPPSPPTKDQF